MTTYIVKHGGQPITQVYFDGTSAPLPGDVLNLQTTANANFDADVPRDVAKKAYRVVSIDMSGAPVGISGMHHSGEPEPTIYVEPVTT
jgi:hypothetical protein